MDRNTIIGLILILVVLFGFSYLNRPSQEQIEAQKHYQDSINMVRLAEQLAEQQAANSEFQTDQSFLSAENDSAQDLRLQSKYGDFHQAALGEEKWITLENELMSLQISTKGGRVYSAKLKEFTDYKNNILTLFDGNESDFNATLVTNNNRVVDTDRKSTRLNSSH